MARQRCKEWYVLNVHGARENTIGDEIMREARKARLAPRYIGRVLVPTQRVRIQRAAKWKLASKTKFANYLFIEMIVTPFTIAVTHAVKGVYSLLPSSDSPVALSEGEVLTLLAECKQEQAVTAKTAPVVIPYNIGDNVRVVRGPYTGQAGIARDIDEPRPGEAVVTVEVRVLGAPVKLTLPYWQIGAV